MVACKSVRFDKKQNFLEKINQGKSKQQRDNGKDIFYLQYYILLNSSSVEYFRLLV